ncbi:hypothetical protein [Actinomadura napierensis]|uniref:ATP-binding protein n=1 Tax=Actinomadura napierensis TaxID=267854 RepID=A0ABN3A799_9ACTN
MTTQTGPQISHAHGPVQAGDAPQNNYNYNYMLRDSKGREPRKKDIDELEWLWQRFVEPPGLGTARDVLKRHSTVFLEGLPGSGRLAAAKMLLWQLAQRPVHEIVLQDEERSSCLDLDHVGESDCILLDLSTASENDWNKVHGELSSLRSRTRDRNGHLVVVLPPRNASPRKELELEPELLPFCVELGEVPSDTVFRRYLKQDDVPFPTPLPSLPPLTARPSLERVARYAHFVVVEHKKGIGGSSFTEWCEVAERALSGHRDELARHIAKLTRGTQRAFLLVTAMLHGAHAETVYRGATEFLRIMEQPPEDVPLLEHSPLQQRLADVNASLDDSGHVHFEETGYDAAVRSYIWTHLPFLQGHIREWVARTAQDASLSDTERTDLIGRFTALCLTDRHCGLLPKLVENWTEKPPSRPRIAAAALVLQDGLRHRAHGRFFRRRIYEWSKRHDAPPALAEVVMVACRDEMVVSHPDEAIVRLHHLARRERGTRARDALTALVRDNPRLLRQMLDRVTLPSTDERRRASDAPIFLALADPALFTSPGARGRPLLDDAAVQAGLTDGWDRAIGSLPEEAWAPAARAWLRYALDDGRHRDLLLDLLIAGCAHRPRVLARMYTLAREAAPHADLEDLVLRKIRTGRRSGSL